ncbi:MAG TPA: AAA family ATPase, partial [Puia sp.]|nr:AAA family ATPase [Puia sp.]
KNWILFFDEADAIFGKRTGVRDAHDKYANQEVSYLLQRIEEFDGLIILSTNMKTNIDDAFIRRFDDIVKFSMPTEEEREEIWEKVFTDKIDYGKIHQDVKKYQLSGANISNVIHYAGIKAVKKMNESSASDRTQDNSELINDEQKKNANDKLKYYLEDIMEGIRKEMIKEGRPFSF